MAGTPKRFFLFFLLVLVLNVLVFTIMHHAYYGKYQVFPEEKSYAGLLLADSHGLCLGKETEKAGIFNFSSESDNYGDMRIKFSFFHRRHPELKILLLSADDHTLSLYREEMNNKDRNVIYRSFPEAFSEREFSGVYNYLKDLIRYYLVIFNPKAAGISKRFLAGKLFQIEEGPQVPDWNQPSQKESMARVRFQSQFPGKERSGSLRKELIALISDCRRAGIKVIGIRFPLSPLYLSMVNGHGYGAEEVLKNEGIEVLNFEQSIPDSAGNFENQDHLTLKGGRIFASLLARKLKTGKTAELLP